ncbi:hypothetical protein BGX31_001311 [Mortierella sp. GBA43]|nr:hypothetical protein BGX31_001311 [Mortierella sp. GBA43]
MNVNAASFTPQGTGGGDKPSGNTSGFRSSLAGTLAGEGKKSNQRATPPANQSRASPAEQQQRSLPGRGKNQRQSSSKRSGHDREPSRASNVGRTPASPSSTSSWSSTAAADSLAVSMSQLSTAAAATGDKATRGNKKNQVSLNHLLNFSFPVREEPQNTGPVRRRRNANYQPFDKERFINANFRFLMSPRKDYEVFTMDADVRVEWDDIEQVLISVPQSCPICLQSPVAARITKCGHVYCLPCILHYLALSESNKAWRKCPICWDSIYEKDLKSVRTAREEHHDDLYDDQGEKEIARQIASKQEVVLEMRLIQRALTSTIALPRSSTFPLNDKALPQELKNQPPLEFYPDAMNFSRLMITTLDRIVAEYDRDLQSIEMSVAEARGYGADDHSEEMVFFEMATNKIVEARDKIRNDAKFFPKSVLEREKVLRQHLEKAAATEEELATTTTTEENGDDPTAAPVRTISYNDSGPEAYAAAQQGHFVYTPTTATTPTNDDDGDDDEDATPTESGTELESDVPTSEAGTAAATAAAAAAAAATAATTPATTTQGRHRAHNQVTSTFYFYQAANGHHLYLQPLDIRILKQHFETYEKFPNTIKVKVLGIEETNLTEEVRKKCKYLGHLPLGCEVSFLDVVLEDVVGKEGVKAFETELRMRRSKRLEKEAREERERIAREHKLNPVKSTRSDDYFINDPFFQTTGAAAAAANGRNSTAHNNNNSSSSTSTSTTTLRRSTDAELAADLHEAMLRSSEGLLDDMPTLHEAHARSQRPPLPQSGLNSGSNPRDIPQETSGGGSSKGSDHHWGSSYESSGSNSQGRTVWGTPSVPVSRYYDSYEEDFEDEHDYEAEVVVKRGKKKVVLMSSNSTRRTR